MRVHFEIPDLIWARLVDEAQARETSVAHLMSAAVLTLVQQDTGRVVRAAARQKRVVDLVRQGFTDAEISRHTGETNAYVAENRRRAGLAPNKPSTKEIAA